MKNASVPLLKDLAGINRWEYTPFCPICGGEFLTSSSMQILECKHYVCEKCMRHLLTSDGTTLCPFDGQEGSKLTTAEAIGESLEFLRNWFQYAEKEPNSEAVIARLLNEIDTVRDALNMEDIPCRVKINGGTCSGDLNCMCDHNLRFYQKKQCPLPDCPNERCMFIHDKKPSLPVVRESEAPAVPEGTQQVSRSLVPNRPQRQGAGSSRSSPKACCSLL